ncbi:MAG TPA: ATP synthase subunit I [Solimonas sp.]
MIRKAIGLQWGLLLLCAGLAWLIAGAVAGQSLLWGGMAVALPNALFATWLAMRMRVASAASAPAVMAGEMLKLGLTLMLLIAVARQPQEQLSWPALLIGVIVALKGHWLALLIMRR